MVACVGVATEKTIGHCSYMQSGSLPHVRSSVDITLRDAHSGSLIARTTIDGPLDPCPLQIMVATESLGGAHPTFSDARTWLAQFVEK
jgi:hypothetical protein